MEELCATVCTVEQVVILLGKAVYHFPWVYVCTISETLLKLVHKLIQLGRNVCYGDPGKFLDFGDMWPWPLTQRACLHVCVCVLLGWSQLRSWATCFVPWLHWALTISCTVSICAWIDLHLRTKPLNSALERASCWRPSLNPQVLIWRVIDKCSSSWLTSKTANECVLFFFYVVNHVLYNVYFISGVFIVPYAYAIHFIYSLFYQSSFLAAIITINVCLYVCLILSLRKWSKTFLCTR